MYMGTGVKSKPLILPGTVRKLDKTGRFFAPSSSCFYAKDDESTSSAAHEFGVCTLVSASGFGQSGSCVLPGRASWWAIYGEGRNYGGVNC